MAQRLPASQASAGQGWVWTGRSLGAVVGLLGGGWMQEVYGGRFMYRFFAAVVFAGMLIYACANALTRNRNALKHSGSSGLEQVEGH